MSWLMTIVGPLAWPATALFLAMMFRDDIRRSLGRVGRLRYRDLEVTFRDDLRQAEALARALPIASASPKPPAPPLPPPSIILEAARDEDREISGRMIGDLEPSGPGPDEDRGALVRLARESPREAVEAAWGIVGRSLVRLATLRGDRRISDPTQSTVAHQFLVARGVLVGTEALLIELLKTLRDRSAHPEQPGPSPDEARRYVNLALQIAGRIGEGG